ncbi:isocitrate lyase/PEP mutase family protein [uncultured Alsobacter sp.]|uniref:isocitrate lyase/PEP mutase family protein n=1 Tax=uncultured Alsobacter sp. TaxID=1748258 RepID=UPI0025DAB5D9|nr:isocitrate lyase/PEP mutase family protein [uncultured Alsobacter sp.]
MSTGDRRDAYRRVLAGGDCARPAIVHDPLTARMAEVLGYPLGMIPGSDVALSVLGAPDIALVTMSEFVDQVRRMTRATALPLMADGDHGYGNALNVRRFVADLDAAGLCGVTIEDTDLPAPYGAAKGRLIPLEEAVGKLRAALEGRADHRFAVIGRTSLLLAEDGLTEIAARLKAYEAAGVDALFVQGLKERSQLERLCAVTTLPFVIPQPVAALEDAAWLAACRVRVAFPQTPKAMAAAIDAGHAALVAGSPARTPIADSHAELLRILTRADAYRQAARDYLAAED